MKTYLIYWKRVLLIFIAVAISLLPAFIVHASSEEFSYIDDRQGIFSESLKKSYNKKFRSYLKYRCFLLVTVDNQRVDDTNKLAQEYLDINGAKEKYGVILLYFNLYNNSVGLASRGEARDIFLPEYNEIFFEHTKELLYENPSDYEELMRLYENYAASVLESCQMEKTEASEIKNFVDDTQGYFSEETVAKVNERLTKADSIFDMDIKITAQKTCNKNEIDSTAIQYMKKHSLGENREDCAFLLYISKKPRKFSLMAKDRAQDIFSESKRTDIFNAMLPFMKENRYDEALEVFVDMTLKDLKKLSIRKALSIPKREEKLYFYEYVKQPLSDDLQRKINAKLEAVSDLTDTDIVVCVKDNGTEENLSEYVRKFAIKNRLGDKRANDAVIFYIDINKESCFLTGRGRGLRLIHGMSDDFMKESLQKSLAENEYEKSIDEFIEKIENQIQKVLKREDDKAKGPQVLNVAVSGLLFGIPTGIIGFLLIFKKTLKKAKANPIFDYKSTIKYVANISFHVKNDILINSTKERVYDRNDDSDSSSSSGSSSSSSSGYSDGGSSYGGTSGDY